MKAKSQVTRFPSAVPEIALGHFRAQAATAISRMASRSAGSNGLMLRVTGRDLPVADVWHAARVRAVDGLEILRGRIVVDDQWETINSDRYRRVLPDKSRGIEVERCRVLAGHVEAMCNFKKAIE